MSTSDIALLLLVFFGALVISMGYTDRKVENDYCGMDFILNVQSAAYVKGYSRGKEDGKVVTVYLCRDWIPTVGYKAWRQCNMDYVVQKELEFKGEE